MATWICTRQLKCGMSQRELSWFSYHQPPCKPVFSPVFPSSLMPLQRLMTRQRYHNLDPSVSFSHIPTSIKSCQLYLQSMFGISPILSIWYKQLLFLYCDSLTVSILAILKSTLHTVAWKIIKKKKNPPVVLAELLPLAFLDFSPTGGTQSPFPSLYCNAPFLVQPQWLFFLKYPWEFPFQSLLWLSFPEKHPPDLWMVGSLLSALVLSALFVLFLDKIYYTKWILLPKSEQLLSDWSLRSFRQDWLKVRQNVVCLPFPLLYVAKWEAGVLGVRWHIPGCTRSRHSATPCPDQPSCPQGDLGQEVGEDQKAHKVGKNCVS